ncbi:MAG: Mth938-like domain-containing protein, partial [Pseudomonadota bacterium]
ITGYGPSGFRISGTTYGGAVLVRPHVTLAVPVTDLAQLAPAHLACLVEGEERTEILLIGCGARMRPVPPALARSLALAGIAADPMDSGAAARTYNVLMLENRRVAALLLPLT